MSEGAGVRDELLGQFLEGRVVVENHLAQARKRGVGLVVRHLVGRVKQAQDGLREVKCWVNHD